MFPHPGTSLGNTRIFVTYVDLTEVVVSTPREEGEFNVDCADGLLRRVSPLAVLKARPAILKPKGATGESILTYAHARERGCLKGQCSVIAALGRDSQNKLPF